MGGPFLILRLCISQAVIDSRNHAEKTMNLLVLYSSAELGHDPMLKVLNDELVAVLQKGKSDDKPVAVFHDVVNDVKPELLGGGCNFDAVIVISALDWYISRRLMIKGRYWMCMVAFGLADIVPLIRLNLSAPDTGIKTLFTNCAEFVKQASAAIPVRFTWKPALPPSSPCQDLTFGSVLPNVLDRDFSQFKWTADFLEAAGHGDKLKLYVSKDEKMRLPAGLEKYIVKVEPLDVFGRYSRIKYFVPVPRILDYRGGVLSPEVIQAAHNGCQPMLIFHPLLAKMESSFTLFRSLTAYGEGLTAALNGDDAVTVSLTQEMCPAPKTLAEQIGVAYTRWKANAPA